MHLLQLIFVLSTVASTVLGAPAPTMVVDASEGPSPLQHEARALPTVIWALGQPSWSPGTLIQLVFKPSYYNWTILASSEGQQTWLFAQFPKGLDYGIGYPSGASKMQAVRKIGGRVVALAYIPPEKFNFLFVTLPSPSSPINNNPDFLINHMFDNIETFPLALPLIAPNYPMP